MKNSDLYLKREIDEQLKKWKDEISRKPLLLRGARQVGKSSAVRHFGKRFQNFVEINFETNIEAKEIFEKAKNIFPKDICDKLSVLTGKPILPGKTLLFFDEIQKCLPAIMSLRYFKEDYPELHVIAAGSLLEFALEEMSSFGVGRIRSLFMYPFSFFEYLEAIDNSRLKDVILSSAPSIPMDNVIHEKAVEHLRTFLIIGGMPEVISTFVRTKSTFECQKILDDLIISLRADFSKYKKKMPTLRIDAAFQSVARQNGGKFIYATQNSEYNSLQMKEAVELLIKAGLVIPATHSSANGIPLGSQGNIKKRKMLLLDTGILQRLLGLQLADIIISTELKMVNKGGIAELFAGLELIKSDSPYEQVELFYWQREERNGQAEVDYLIQKGSEIIPIEVKSGTHGQMQSLRLFMNEKKSRIGMRLSLENFAVYDNIEVLPLYAAGLIKKEWK